MIPVRFKADGKVAYYHCFSRVVHGRPPFSEEDKEQFVQIMRGYEFFCGVRVLTYCIMDHHFRVLVEVPPRPAAGDLPNDRELLRRIHKSHYLEGTPEWIEVLARSREMSEEAVIGLIREKALSRMWDVSWFIKMLKQRFTQGINRRVSREGHLWGGLFRSLLVDGTGPALVTLAAYIDLDSVRSGNVAYPKDYRWSGYAEAVRGGKLARKGLQTAVEAWRGHHVAVDRVMADYRFFLLSALGTEGSNPNEANSEQPSGKGKARIGKESPKKEGMELFEALRHEVRAFSHGAVIGSRAFVEDFFQSHRNQFGPTKKKGAYKLRGINAPELFVARELRSRTIT